MIYRDLDKQVLKENGYSILSKITLLNDNSVFTEDDFIVNWNYEDYRYVPNTGFIGQFVERILDGNLQNIPDNKIFENQEINLQLGIVNGIDEQTTWYDYGNFLITKVEKTDTTGNYKFESADYTKKFNKEYEDTISYPCIAMELADNVCDQAGVYLDSTDYAYYHIVPEEGLSTGDYSFKINNMYYRFTVNEDLIKNDVLMFIASQNEMILKKVRNNNVTRETLTYAIAPATDTYTLIENRTTEYIDFTNNDFVIENNQYDEKDTLRKVMQDIGKLAYSWVRVGEDNKVHIDFEQVEQDNVDNYDKLSTDEYYMSKKSDLYFGPVNKVVLGMSNIEGESLYKTSSTYTEATECAIRIFDNNLTYTEELRAIALNGCERLFGIEYMPLEIETIGHPWLEGDELIKLTNVDGEELYTYPFNRSISYEGYIEGKIGSEAETKQNNEYEYESEIVKQINKTSITVDKNSQTITSLVSNVTEAQNNITELYQTTNEISATVDYLNDEYESNIIIRKDAEGNPIEIDDGGNYPLEDFKIYGGTSQEGTPSPTNPIDIDTVTSKTTTIDYSGTNIDIDYDYDQDLIKVERSNFDFDGNTIQDTVILPSGYTQVEYIQSNGTNAINTSFAPNQNTKVEVVVSDITGSNQFVSPFGYRNGNTKQFWCYFDPATTNKTFKARYNTTEYSSTYNYTSGGKIKISMDKTGFYIDDVLKTSAFSSATFTADANMYLFATNNNGSGQWNCVAKLYSAKIWDNGTLKRYFVPCYRNSDNVIGLYEIVGGAFYTAQGTGTFTKGSNVTLPTPDYPQEVQNVTGRQEVNVCGKNLIDVSTTEIGKSWNNTSNSARAVVYAKVEPNTTYTVSFQSKNGADALYWFEKNNKTDSTATVATTGINFTLTKTTSANTHWVGIQINKSNVTLSDVEGTSLQLEKGSTATNYEPYIGNSYEINLGKNLLDLQDGTYTNNGVTAIVNNNEISINGTAGTGNSYINIPYSQTIEPTIEYTLSLNNDFTTSNTSDGLRLSTNDDTRGSFTALNRTKSFTFQNALATNQVTIRLMAGSSISNGTMKVQLEKGSQSTSYAPYKTPIELCKIGNYQDKIYKGKGTQLFDKDNAIILNAYISTDKVISSSNDDKTIYIKCEPNTTYTISKMLSSPQNQNKFRVTTTNTIPVIGATGIDYVGYSTGTDVTSITITTSANANYLCVFMINVGSSTTTLQEMLNSIMINEGSIALPYEPYNAKDKWYLHKEIGKTVFNGSETGWTRYGAYGNTFLYYIDNKTNGYTTSSGTFNYGLGLSNNFKWITDGSQHDFAYTRFQGNNGKRIYFAYTSDLTADQWKTWLSTHNTIVYYVLATPTDTEISDDNLINQLEELNNSEFYSPITYYNTESSNLAIISNFSISHLPYKIITINDENNNQLSYKPLFRNLELCKIGEYQDYLYLKNGKWYKHSEIAKIVLDGTESWSYGTSSGYPRCTINSITDLMAYTDTNRHIGRFICSHFTPNTTDETGHMYQYQGTILCNPTSDITSLDSFKTWLANNNVTLYYVLADSTETEITEEEIITELNTLMQNAIYAGYNRIYLNDELCEKLYIRYLTDSILNDTYATRSQLAITNENISAVVSKNTALENNLAQLQVDVDGINTSVQSVETITTNLENSINYLAVDMSANSVIIPTNEENLPYLSTTYTIPFTATFKGTSVNPTVSTSSPSITGITLTFGTGVVNVGVSSTTAITNLTNSFVINFSYINEGETYVVSKTLNVALSVKGEDGKDGTSVTILGSYNTLAELQSAHPVGNAGDSYMVGDDLYVWNVSSLAWVDVGQIKGDDGVNAYLYIRYSENPNGNPMVTTPTTSTKYIGVCSTTSNTAPTSYTAYTWSKYSGTDGQTTYLHIKYSEDGLTFVPAGADVDEGDTPSAWVGLLTDTNPVASTTFGDYTWYKFTEDIDDTIRSMQSDIANNSTNILNNYTAIIQNLDQYAKADIVAKLTQTVETNTTNTDYAISIIRDLEINGVSQVRTEKGFTFNNNGMTIDATDSVTKSVTDTNGIRVLDKSGSSESELLFAGYDETSQTSIVRTENLSVSTYFNIGTKSRFEDYEDGTGVFI